MPGNFFEAVPPGCDAYVLKNVLHDWDDALCGQILQVCRAAMPGNARLLVAETLVERLQTSGMGPLSDMQMMLACREGRERSRKDFIQLLKMCRLRGTARVRAPCDLGGRGADGSSLPMMTPTSASTASVVAAGSEART